MLVDARGLRCPVPVLRLAQALARLPDRAVVRLLATDPAARTDVPAFCRMRRVELVAVLEVAEPGGPGHTAYLVAQVRPSEPAPGPAAPAAGGPDSPPG